MKTLALLFLSTFLVIQINWAQQDSLVTNRALENFFKNIKEESPVNEKASDSSMLPDKYKPSYAGDSIVNLLYKESLRAYFQYRKFGYSHRQKVFKWQLLSSKIIFVIVVSLVMAGIYFSYLQFKKIMQEIPADKVGENLSSKIAIDAKGSSNIDSRVLGVIILFISLVFFYLYLLYVYPVEEIF